MAIPPQFLKHVKGNAKDAKTKGDTKDPNPFTASSKGQSKADKKKAFLDRMSKSGGFQKKGK